jgi:hypothetical protein
MYRIHGVTTSAALPAGHTSTPGARIQEQHPADNYRGDASPYRELNAILLLHGKMNRTKPGFMGGLGITEAAIYQSQRAGGQKNDSQNSEFVHSESSCVATPGFEAGVVFN